MGDLRNATCPKCGKIHSSLESCDDYVLAPTPKTFNERLHGKPLTKSLGESLEEMRSNPELAEVVDMQDEYLAGIMNRDGAIPAINKSIDHTYVDSPSPQARQSDRFKIVVYYENPPIPDRSHDWQAYYEGQEEMGQYGEGSTPYMAILDLINNINPTEWWEKQNG